MLKEKCTAYPYFIPFSEMKRHLVKLTRVADSVIFEVSYSEVSIIMFVCRIFVVVVVEFVCFFSVGVDLCVKATDRLAVVLA